MLVLSQGLDFYIHPQKINEIEVFIEFESLFTLLVKHVLTYAENVSHLKAHLNELAYDFVKSLVDSKSYL